MAGPAFTHRLRLRGRRALTAVRLLARCLFHRDGRVTFLGFGLVKHFPPAARRGVTVTGPGENGQPRWTAAGG